MADSFADLWNSTAPSKPTPPPPKLGTAQSNSSFQQRRPQNDVFSLLSSAGSSAPNSRPITPSTSGRPIAQKPAAKPVSSSNGDAFSGLLAGTLNVSTSNANMTIAERAAHVERQKSEQLRRNAEAAKMQASAWSGLDTLAGSSTSAPQIVQADDDWGFGSKSNGYAKAQVAAGKAQLEDDDWGLGEFSSKPVSKDASPSHTGQGEWDIDLLSSSSKPAPSSKPASFKSPPARASQSLWDLDTFSSPSGNERSNSPGDFDFGDREDGPPTQDDDDILGVLSKPVDATPKPPPRNRTPPPPRPAPTRASSPPPHIIGQIVEMGFAPQQARVALAATESGVDVEAALESLLGAQTAERPSPPRAARPSRGRAASSGSAAGASAQPQTAAQLQEHADKLLAQASEIGASVFSRANAFWNTGKERVVKAYEERAAAESASKGKARDGRPRWMQEAVGSDEEREEGGRRREKERFVDDADVKRSPPRASNGKVATAPPVQAQRPKEEDLFGGSAPSIYISPFRRGRPKASSSASAPVVPSAPARPPSPITRKAITAPPSAIAASAKHKAAGTEMFKLGRYAEAATAYTLAIDALPATHLLRVPLHNNRALARLRTGEHAGAVEDCTAVVGIVGDGYHPARERRVQAREEGAEVDLGDGLVKAWKRRAEAWEGREKWDDARKDWERVAAADWAGQQVRGEAVRGAGRCRRMATDAVGAPAKKPPPPKKPAPAPRPRPTAPSQALNQLRAANNAAEAEDEERYQLKDKVDARLLAWKGGKETNIRALIASLDTVLWPELGWVKVGMGELVSPSQVKIRYTKAIAKLHPDKLNTGNTTLEQRMIANGVFGALNEAWNAFKQ
ncbi:hypothetical protein PLICRDRAFT_127526 [Plicaturopsis crispa FD-325 SS-3]|nr:hypothetical protein PLICRDRAFT_127526 [Plicaturopsis crispa FD-325 SS-3]